ncbi:hypothetical protein GO002_28490 [Streptomyces eurocidicus]|nr:hypothetical protein [Streptomyces eurocidicus]
MHRLRRTLRWLPVLGNTSCPNCGSPLVMTEDGKTFRCMSCQHSWE